MYRRLLLFLVLLISAGAVKTQSIQLPALLQLEMAKNPRSFETGAAAEKALRPSDFLLLSVEVAEQNVWQNIRDIGGEVNTQFGTWGTVRLPRSAVRSLTDLPGLEAIHYNTLFSPHNEEAIINVQADKVHEGLAPLPRGYSGKDVVVGIIDTGIDYLHADFRDPDDPGRSRIVSVWDQWESGGDSPNPFTYGVEWDRQDIETEIAAQAFERYIHLDTFPEGSGHGTHVSGTAAGNRGVAYEADLIMVSTIFTEAGIIDAANYIIRKAEAMGKPCVINLSLGSNTHAHDGTDFMSERLSQLVEGREGVAIVASAGNDGDELAHWGGFPLSEEPASVYYGGGTGVYAYFRIPKADLPAFELNIAVDTVHYEGGILRSVAEIGATSWLKLSELDRPYYQQFFYENDSLAAELYIFDNSAQERDHAEFFIYLDEGLNRYNWVRNRDKLELFRFYVRGNGSFHAWFSSLRLYTFPNPAIAGRTESNYRPPDSEFNLGSPCDGRNVICVGAYTNRTGWVDTSGRRIDPAPNQAVGELANFSSTGPTMDGRIKPEIVAPGRIVASAVPRYNRYGALLVSAAPPEAVFSGTSMSAPVVSGAIALLLEENPNLTYEEIRNFLTGTAIQDEQSLSRGALPNGYWGYGKLNVYEAMLGVLGVTSAKAPGRAPASLRISPNPASETVRLQFNGSLGNQALIRLRDLTGRTLFQANTFPETQTLEINVGALPRGLYLLEWTDGEQRAVEKLVVN